MDSNIDIRPQDIVLFHVGGCGSYGPIDSILKLFPRQCVVFAFEARDSADDIETQQSYEIQGVRTILVNACIANSVGTARLFVNKQVASSSMLPPSPQALNEHIVPFAPPEVTTWGENTELDHEITLRTISLRRFIKERNIIPDVLSIDAQGMELRIMKGTGSAINFINTIVSEVEFFEIYSGQALFHEQFDFLADHGFRLTDLLNSQSWHPGPACGQGFLTVAEALWFKKINTFLEFNEAGNYFLTQGIKLAAVGFAFERFSYTYTLLKELMHRDKDEVVELCHKLGFDVLLQLVEIINKNLPDYTVDNQLFLKHVKLSDSHVFFEEASPIRQHPDEAYLDKAQFDEAVYLRKYPDVALAVQRGVFRSGWEHFMAYGRFENRSSRPI
ncbi:MAG: FkbM family methyltransferase [Anaerolineales bacterium]|nr:FkbM family methyltransferase [Anaerolineales bacterium]